jgi:hypothetical protein
VAVLGLATVLIALVCAASASAGDKFKYDVVLHPLSYSGSPSGGVTVNGLDTSLTTTIKVTVGGVPAAPAVFAAGPPANRSVSGKTFVPGDTITVEQPSGTFLETFTIPNVSLTGTVGSTLQTGHAPDGTVSILGYRELCQSLASDDFVVQPQGGAFTFTIPKPLAAGQSYSLLNYPGKGDTVRYDDVAPGETPCIYVSGDPNTTYPGNPPDPTPYSFQAFELRSVVATGARILLRRGGAVLVDYTNASASYSIGADSAVQPLPGDVVELYRPQGAGSPSATFTIPAVSAVYDPSISLVAVDAPAASRIEAEAGTFYAMFSAQRAAVNTAPGRTFLNFAENQSYERPFSLASPDYLAARWYSQDATRTYSVAPAPGDLVAPTISIKLAKKFKLAKLGTSLSASITSSEAAVANLKLTLPGKLKTSAAKAKAPRVIATAKVTLRAGVTKVKVKFTKSGKKLIAKMRKKHYPTNKATLSIVATDFSGNAGAATKSTKLASR